MQQEIDFHARADAGIERAARKAERREPGWIDDAVRQLRAFAIHCDSLIQRLDFTIDEARPVVEIFKPRPADVDGRVWGAVTRQAVQLGYIERVPGKFREAASSNGSPKPVYRKGPAA